MITNTSPINSAPKIDRHPHFNKSAELESVLHGCHTTQSSHFADQLQRFQRDFAAYHKEQLAANNQKRKETLAKKNGQRENFLHQIYDRNAEVEKKKENFHATNLELFDLGEKKNGMSSGIPVNPINHQYQNTYGGRKYQNIESQKHLSELVRTHNLYTKSSCGYNLINGKQNRPIKQRVPEAQKEAMESRIKECHEHYQVRPPYF